MTIVGDTGQRLSLALAFGLGLSALTLESAVAGIAQPDTDPVQLAEPTIAEPQPDPDTLAPGLAVKYWYARLTHIDRLTEWMESQDGKEGPPLPQINYSVGVGDVLTSRGSDLVGAQITGYIHLETAGTYEFHIVSNDGVRLTIGDVMMHEDPRVHSDTLSPPLLLPVSTPGWYPIEILYYEKKGTSTLILQWQPPNAEGRQVVPAEAFAHPSATAKQGS